MPRQLDFYSFTHIEKQLRLEVRDSCRAAVLQLLGMFCLDQPHFRKGVSSCLWMLFWPLSLHRNIFFQTDKQFKWLKYVTVITYHWDLQSDSQITVSSCLCDWIPCQLISQIQARPGEAGKIQSKASLVLRLCPVWQLHLWSPMPDNIPYPTPYPLDNWQWPGQFCHTHLHTHKRMFACPQGNQTCQTHPLYGSRCAYLWVQWK